MYIVPRERSPSNSEADTLIIGRTLQSRYAAVDPSTEPNRPHISSDTGNVKERETKTTRSAVSCAARPPVSSLFFLHLRGLHPSGSRPEASLRRSVRAYLRTRTGVRKGFFRGTSLFLGKPRFPFKIWALAQGPAPYGGRLRKNMTPRAARFRAIRRVLRRLGSPSALRTGQIKGTDSRQAAVRRRWVQNRSISSPATARQ
jgi:hypothetical protein